MTISQNYKNTFTVPGCMQLNVKQYVYTTEMDIPYTAKIGYTNGVNIDYENIQGKYRGVVAGNIEVSLSANKIC